MDIPWILDNIRKYIEKNNIPLFKIGFVGNGEPLLEFIKLQEYIERISDLLQSGIISAYTITNGTVINRNMIEYLTSHNVNIGFSVDGPKNVHDKWRCDSFDRVMQNVELYREITGKYPSINCTIGKDSIDNAESVIKFFGAFGSRITFSRMIGKYSVSLAEFNDFLDMASENLNVRRGGVDCTMYGGMCGAGINNFFYANGKIYICGNCVDIISPFTSDTSLDNVQFAIHEFDRNYCYKESVLLR